MTGDRDDLGDELRRLFEDKRFAVPPRAGAEDIVVAGAQRIRRRRAALAAAGGALAVVALAGSGLALGGLRTGPAQVALPPATQPVSSVSRPAPVAPPAASTPEPTTTAGAQPGDQAPPPETQSRRSSPHTTAPSPSSESTRVPAVSGSVLGPTGYGALRLGMSFEAARATGMLAGAAAPPTGCTTYLLAEGSSAVSGVYLSPTAGILRFEASGAHTPENAGIGSTLAQLRAAYPDLAKGSSTYSAPAGSGGSYVFYVDDSDVVTAYELIGPAVTC